MIFSRIRRLISPVYTKELVQIAAQKRGAWVKLLFLLALLITTVISLWDYRHYQGEDLTSLGRNFFTVLCVVDLVAVAVLTPLIASGAIAGEKEANTLGLLLITRLRPWNIVQDKALSRITQLLYLVGLTFPFMALALLLGGVEWYQIAGAMLYLVSCVLFGGGIAVFFSSIRQNHVRAAASAYVYIFLIFILSSIAAGLVTGFWHSKLLAGAINPAAGFVFLLEPYNGFSGATEAICSASMFLACSSGIYFICVALAAIIIKRQIQKGPDPAMQPEAKKEGADDDDTPRPKLSWRQRLTRPIHMKATRMLNPHTPPSFDPLKALWALTKTAGRHKIVTVLILGAVGLPGIVGGPQVYRSLPFYIVFYFFAGPFLGIVVLLKAATCFSQDKQHNRFPILAATRFRGPDVVKGTYQSIWHAVYPYILIFTVVMLLSSFVIDRHDPYFDEGISFMFPIAFVMYVNFIIIVGMRVSLFCKNNARAIAGLIAVLAIVCVWPVIAVIATDPFVVGDMEELLLLSPAAMLGPGLLADEVGEAFERHPGLCILHFVLINGASLAVYVWMRLRYDRIVGRQPGRRASMELATPIKKTDVNTPRE